MAYSGMNESIKLEVLRLAKERASEKYNLMLSAGRYSYPTAEEILDEAEKFYKFIYD